MSGRAMRWAWAQRAPGRAAKVVLLCLADHANEDAVAWPSVATVAARCDITPRTVRRALADLMRLGLVSTDERGRAGGRGTTRYRLPVSSKPGETPGESVRPQAPPTPGESVRPPLPNLSAHPGQKRQGIPTKEPKKEPKEEDKHSLRSVRASSLPPIALSPEQEQAFLAFWDAYPRKERQGPARAAWRVAMTKTNAATVLTAVRRAVWPEEPRFVQQPANWLRDEGWLNGPAPKKPDAIMDTISRYFPHMREQEAGGPTIDGEAAG